jgi:hypothetical protein
MGFLGRLFYLGTSTYHLFKNFGSPYNYKKTDTAGPVLTISGFYLTFNKNYVFSLKNKIAI